jgi:hypothetical protein
VYLTNEHGGGDLVYLNAALAVLAVPCYFLVRRLDGYMQMHACQT